MLATLGLAGPARAQAQARAQELEDVSVHGSRSVARDLEETVSGPQARATAGTHDDPAQIVADLPGVARPSFDSGQLIVWGSPPMDTQVFVDGVPIPALFHGTAIRSTIGGAMVRGITLSPGAYGVDFGRGLGGVVRVDTADVPARYREAPVHAEIDADTLDGGATVSAAPAEGVRLEAAGRYGWIASTSKALGTRDVGDFYAVPQYRDVQAKAQFDLRERESLDVVVLGSGDDLTRSIPDPDPSRARSQSTSTAFQRAYLHYRRELDDGAVVDVVPWAGHDVSHLDDRFGGAPATLDQDAVRWGLRASERARLAPRVAIRGGLDVDGSHASLQRQGSLAIPPREGDVTVFGQPPGAATNADAWTADVTGVAPYVALDVEAGPITVTPGLRFDAYLLEASRQTPRLGQTPSIGLSHLDGRVEPNLAGRVRVTPAWALVAAAGLYSQAPAASDLSAVFGTPTLGPESALHVTAGETLRIAPRASLEVLGFYKALWDLAVRDPSATPALARVLLDDGIGRAYGVQWLLRQDLWRGFSGWVAYTLSRSERRDAPGAPWRLFDDDQPHTLAVVATQSLGPWSLGARLRFARGLPRTPVLGALYDASGDAYQPLFGAQNSIRLPDFWQLDLRVDRAFALGRGARLTLSVEGLNVTDDDNGEEYVYSADYSRRGTVSGLPILGVVGAKVEL
ncbi:MAG TPA: hypothetical protein VHV30_09930 [Polyangiaceae bacterium]|nr:hypothetical protein [Polyangiaceae bacterium]